MGMILLLKKGDSIRVDQQYFEGSENYRVFILTAGAVADLIQITLLEVQIFSSVFGINEDLYQTVDELIGCRMATDRDVIHQICEH